MGKGLKRVIGKSPTSRMEDLEKNSKKVTADSGGKAPLFADKISKEKEKEKEKCSKSKGKLKHGKDPKWGKDEGKNISRSARAGVQFPVGRIHRFLKKYASNNCRMGGTGAVYIAAVMEYLSAEVLELAGNVAKDLKTKRITPRHLHLAIRGDDELDALVKATIAGGGVVPHIDKSLLTKKGKSKRPADHMEDMVVLPCGIVSSEF